MPNKDLRTRAIILRRTNYGETDRILNLLTPEGKLSVIARGVRKEKSKLAGGIELFSLSDVVVHQGKTDLGLLTSAKMLEFYAQILGDLAKLELASLILKKTNRASEHIISPDFFGLVRMSLQGLNQNLPLPLVESWFLLNLFRISGESVNLVLDVDGQKLRPEQMYTWDIQEKALAPTSNGPIVADHIKLARLILSAPLQTVAKVQNTSDKLPELLQLAKTITAD